ncbi:hypothetical protein PG996_013860 [Apiospora saccharicola]|uniref:Uncharacterized protein n=1 Tax=Apiospora saccharicola TaxID=335842 RepID=A0ABR1TGP0_9PEZI
MIASLAIGPFTQQALKAVACERPVSGAQVSVPVANYVFGSEPVGNAHPASQGQAFHLSASLTGALTSAMNNALGEATVFVVQHNAKYGNTNYSLPNGQSIMVDIQNGVDLSVSVGRADSSNSGSSSNEYKQYGYDNIAWASCLIPEGFDELAPSSILNVSILTYTQAPCSDSPGMSSCFNNIGTYMVNNTRPFAATCALYPCLQSMSGNIVGGILQEKVISTVPASQWLNPDAIKMWNRSMPSFFGRESSTAVRSPCVVNGVVYDTSNFSAYRGASEAVPTAGKPVTNNKEDRMSVPLQCPYKMNNIFAFELAEYLRLQIFQGACASTPSQTAGTTGGDFSCGTWLQGKNINYYRDQFWLEPLFNGGRADLSSIPATFNRFAAGATAQMRIEGTSLFWQQPHQQKREEGAVAGRARSDATGTVLALGMCVAVKWPWPWLLLPLLVLGLMVALLAASLVAAMMTGTGTRRTV